MASGIPGGGKSTVGRALAAALDLPFIDKDDILEELFESRGDGEWRRMLSRKSDLLLRERVSVIPSAVLVSHWRLQGIPQDSGTPAEWIEEIADRIVNVRCVCSPEIAAERFLRRQRHRGHLDDECSKEEILASIRAAAQLRPLDIGVPVEVDTTREWSIVDVARAVRSALLRSE